ncbi:RING finger protein 151-like [Oculina patagonica]
MYGFAPELFVDPVDQDLICGICLGVFNKPVTCPDGHSFCQECITRVQVNDSRCPADRSPLSGTFIRILAVEGMIGRKIMRCPSSVTLPGGCSWSGPRSTLENHLPQCDMKVVECPFKGRGCILRAYRRDLAQHLPICPSRTVNCPSCGSDIPHVSQTAHDNECAGKLVSCPNDCGSQVARNKMLSHFRMHKRRPAVPPLCCWMYQGTFFS